MTFINNFIGHKFLPCDKGNIAKLIKTYFYRSPTTLAIGDGLNDIQMLNECDVGIEICGNGDDIKLNAGDILINDLSKIKDLVLWYGRRS